MLGELINRRGPRRATERGLLGARGLCRRARWGRWVRVPNAPTLRPFAALCGSIARRADACAHSMLGELINRREAPRTAEEGFLGARGLCRRARWGRWVRVRAHWMLGELINRRGPRRATERGLLGARGLCRRARWGRWVRVRAHWMLGELINRRGPRRATERGLLGARGLRRRARWGRWVRVRAHWMLGELINRRGPRRATERGLLGARGLCRRARWGRWVRVRAHWMLGELINHRGPRRATERGLLGARGLRRRARWGRWVRVPKAPTLRPFAALCGSIARRADACAHWMLGELINRRGPPRATEKRTWDALRFAFGRSGTTRAVRGRNVECRPSFGACGSSGSARREDPRASSTSAFVLGGSPRPDGLP